MNRSGSGQGWPVQSVAAPWKQHRSLSDGSLAAGSPRFFRRNRQRLAITAEAVSEPVVGRRSPRLARVEAALLVSEGACTARRIAQCAALLDAGEAKQAVDELNAAYDACGSAFRIERVGAGYQMMTRPVFARWLDRVHHRQERLKLSGASLETLTIVAYRQPITRADIEAIRGVATAEILKQLMDRGLVKIVGEDDSLGRPYLYGTTRMFLEAYGLRSLEELPQADSLRRPAGKGQVQGADQSLATAPDSEAA